MTKIINRTEPNSYADFTVKIRSELSITILEKTKKKNSKPTKGLLCQNFDTRKQNRKKTDQKLTWRARLFSENRNTASVRKISNLGENRNLVRLESMLDEFIQSIEKRSN